MKPLIVAATKFEIHDIIPLLEEKGIPYLITGVGMTATAYALGKLIGSGIQFSCILNIGIAGSFDKNIAIGTVLSINKDTFYELGAEDNSEFISIDDLGFGQGTYHATAQDLHIELPTYNAITVNKVHGNAESIQHILDHHPNITVESMEGAAVFYSCQQEHIPCAQFRAISNYVEPRDKSNWNVALAVKNLNNWLKLFINTNYQY